MIVWPFPAWLPVQIVLRSRSPRISEGVAMLVRTTQLRLLPLDEIRTWNGLGRSWVAGPT